MSPIYICIYICSSTLESGTRVDVIRSNFLPFARPFSFYISLNICTVSFNNLVSFLYLSFVSRYLYLFIIYIHIYMYVYALYICICIYIHTCKYIYVYLHFFSWYISFFLFILLLHRLCTWTYSLFRASTGGGGGYLFLFNVHAR